MLQWQLAASKHALISCSGYHVLLFMRNAPRIRYMATEF